MPETESAPPADTVVARPAATVVLLRDRDGAGVEVHLQQRRAEMDFGGSAYVFPGGSVDAGDAADETLAPLAGVDLGATAARMHLDGDDAARRLCAALHVCAVREVFEEAGLLLAVAAEVAAEPDAGALEAARLRVQRGASFGAELAALGRRAHVETLRYVAHCITPVGAPRRFDTRFFATRAPAGQVDAFHAAEAQLGGWFAPAEVLARHGHGDVFLMPPTQIVLAELSHHRDVDSVLATLGARPVADILFSWEGLGMPLPDHLPGPDELACLGGQL